jgi:3-phytase
MVFQQPAREQVKENVLTTSDNELRFIRLGNRAFPLLLTLNLFLPVISMAQAQQPAVEALRNKVYEVSATIETQPMPNADDSADDPAVWINSARPSASTVIGTDKKGGLAVYDLKGRQLQYLHDGNINNVDIRYNFLLDGRRVALVTAGNRTDNTIAIYRVNPSTRMLENVAARKVITLEVYGSCMYRSRSTGKFYYFVNSKAGHVEQWELFGNRQGRVDARKVRTLAVGSQTEGCVADDETGRFYIGEENVGIWKYGAEPNAGSGRVSVARTSPAGPLASNVEGLTLTYGKNGAGYLIASSQGNSTFVVYRRGGKNQFVKTFRVVDGKGIDGVSETDGIDATTAYLGAAFPYGVFITQDGHNDGNQNFKLVPLQAIIGVRERKLSVAKRIPGSEIKQALKH